MKNISSIFDFNLDGVSFDIFAGEDDFTDMNAVHCGNTLTKTGNAAILSAGTFGGENMSDSDTIEQIADAVLSSNSKSKSQLWMDQEGVIHRGGDTITGRENATYISDGTFAGSPMEGVKASDTGQVTPGLSARSLSDGIVKESVICEPITPSGLQDCDCPLEPRVIIDADAVEYQFSRAIDVPGGRTENVCGNTIAYPVRTVISDGVFGAPSETFSDQWYIKDPSLQKAEMEGMCSRYPKARCFFLPESGDMCWVTDLKIRDEFQSYRIMLRYLKDHPHNFSSGGSIQVMLLSPTVDDLKKRAQDAGYKGVPHILTGTHADGKKYPYLCTRTTDGVKDGKKEISSGVQALTWAADWILHFELSMRNRRIWNNWCDDNHYRSWQVPLS